MRQTNTSLLSFYRHLDLLSEICSHYDRTRPPGPTPKRRTMTTTGGINNISLVETRERRREVRLSSRLDTATTARWEASARDVLGKLGGILSFFFPPAHLVLESFGQIEIRTGSSVLGPGPRPAPRLLVAKYEVAGGQGAALRW